jgi:site-specific DNA-methyltransferase (adenine-specific)
VLAGFPVTTSGIFTKRGKKSSAFLAHPRGADVNGHNGGDTGSAARFFYCAKSSRRDRNEGCEGLEERVVERVGQMPDGFVSSYGNVRNKPKPTANHHPTVKPTALMQYLCRLITPPGGKILDPFCGSGSTGKGAILEGFRFIGIEQDAEYIEIARRRIEWAFQQAHPTTGEFVTKAGKPDDTDGLPMFGGEQ